MKYGIERELSREEAKKLYENSEPIAVVFDRRNPETRVYEFSAETENEPDFDKAVMFFEAKKQMWFKLKCGKAYEEITGEKYEGASFLSWLRKRKKNENLY